MTTIPIPVDKPEFAGLRPTLTTALEALITSAKLTAEAESKYAVLPKRAVDTAHEVYRLQHLSLHQHGKIAESLILIAKESHARNLPVAKLLLSIGAWHLEQSGITPVIAHDLNELFPEPMVGANGKEIKEY